NGLPLEIDSRSARFGKQERAGMIFVDGVDIGDVEDVALRDRRMLSADGIFIVVATISEQDGLPVAPTELIFRGVPFIEESERDGLLDDVRGRDGLDDREPEAAAAPAVAAAADEALEGALADVRGKAGTLVLDDDLDAVVESARGNVHRRVRRRVPQGVLEQVEDHPVQVV